MIPKLIAELAAGLSPLLMKRATIAWSETKPNPPGGGVNGLVICGWFLMFDGKRGIRFRYVNDISEPIAMQRWSGTGGNDMRHDHHAGSRRRSVSGVEKVDASDGTLDLRFPRGPGLDAWKPQLVGFIRLQKNGTLYTGNGFTVVHPNHGSAL